MTGLYVALSVLAFLALLLFVIPIHMTVSAYDGVAVVFRILFIKIPLVPEMLTGERKKKKKTKKKKPKAPKKKGEPAKQGESPDILQLITLVFRVVQAVIRRLSRHLRIRVVTYQISVATGDAAKTALLCGACRAASENLFALMGEVSNFKVKKNADVCVFPNYIEEKTRAAVKIDFSANGWGMLSTLLFAAFAFVKHKNAKINQ